MKTSKSNALMALAMAGAAWWSMPQGMGAPGATLMLHQHGYRAVFEEQAAHAAIAAAQQETSDGAGVIYRIDPELGLIREWRDGKASMVPAIGTLMADRLIWTRAGLLFSDRNARRVMLWRVGKPAEALLSFGGALQKVEELGEDASGSLWLRIGAGKPAGKRLRVRLSAGSD
jgi:hypothetical protein